MRLAVLKSLHEAKDVSIESLPFVIGRCKTANFIIPHLNVSRNHCLIIRDDFSWKIKDFSSSGTYINNNLVGKDNSVTLNENDVIRFGSSENNLEWTFHLSNLTSANSRVTPTFCEQSQKLMDLHTEKCNLQEKIYKNNVLHEIKSNNEKNLNEKLKNCFENTKKMVENKNESIDFKSTNKKRVEEKENSYSNLKNELDVCSNEIVEIENENKRLISHLIEVQKKVEVEMAQLDSCFQREKNNLKEELKQKKIIIQKESESTNKDFFKSLDEQNILIEKLNALEEAQKILLLKLEKANNFDLKNMSCEKNDFIENNVSNEEKISNETKALNFENDNNTKNCNYNLNSNSENSDLIQELKEVKNALSILEDKNLDLEGKLKAAVNKENGTLQNLTDLLETELQCTICSELFVTTVTLNCTHSFCEFCLSSWKKKQKTCPICRKKIVNENRSLVIDTYIDKMVENLSCELKDRRKALIAERNEPIPKKKSKAKKKSKY